MRVRHTVCTAMRARCMRALNGEAYSQRLVSGRLMRMDSTRPPVLSPKVVPRSYTRLNSTYLSRSSRRVRAFRERVACSGVCSRAFMWTCADARRLRWGVMGAEWWSE